MESNTRLVRSITRFIIIIQNKFFYIKNNFSTKLFSLFLGFLIGSLFGTFLPHFPNKINSHSASMIIVIISIEIINYLVYSSKNRNFFLSHLFKTVILFLLLPLSYRARQGLKTKYFYWFKDTKQKEQTISNFKIKTNVISKNKIKMFYKNLNSLKIGIMLGLFIDAFKVGS